VIHGLKLTVGQRFRQLAPMQLIPSRLHTLLKCRAIQLNRFILISDMRRACDLSSYVLLGAFPLAILHLFRPTTTS